MDVSEKCTVTTFSVQKSNKSEQRGETVLRNVDNYLSVEMFHTSEVLMLQSMSVAT